MPGPHIGKCNTSLYISYVYADVYVHVYDALPDYGYVY